MPQRSHPPTDEEVLDLVGQIYASAMEPQRAGEVLRLFSESVGGTWAHTFAWQSDTRKVLHSQFAGRNGEFEQANRAYLSRWGELDPRAAAMAGLPVGEVLRCHDRFDDGFVAASSFYRDFFIPHGLRWSIGGVVNTSGGTATMLTGIRAPDQPPFEDWAVAVLRKLLPHFQRAASIRAKLIHESASNSAIEMLKVLPVPCFFTDQAGRCIERNSAFDSAVELFSLRVVVGRVRFSAPHLQSRWETALSETHATAVAQSFVAAASNGKQWKVHLVPMHSVVPAGDAMDNRMILVVFDAKDLEPPTVQSLTLGAGLTRAELDVATGLLQGLPAKVIAKQRGASVNTVRSQIMSILDKTGHKSQRELMAALGASAFGASSLFASTLQPSSMEGDALVGSTLQRGSARER